MRVIFNNNFNKINFYSHTKQAVKNHAGSLLDAKTTPAKGDTFTKSNFTLQDFYNKKDKFQISDYKDMSETTKQQIRKAIPKDIKNAAETNIDMALNLKTMLDKQYGKNGYVFVSIGRSPSLIAKVFENMGTETKYLPISHIGEEGATLESVTKRLDTTKYSNLLKQQGLTPVKMLANPKKYLFYDYTDKGRSLKIFKELLTKTFHLPKFKMQFKSLNSDLLATNYDDETKIFDYIDEYLKHSSSEKYSSIARLDYFNTPDNDFSTETLTKHDNPNAKFYNFLVIDKLSRYGLLNENLRNQTSL